MEDEAKPVVNCPEGDGRLSAIDDDPAAPFDSRRLAGDGAAKHCRCEAHVRRRLPSDAVPFIILFAFARDDLSVSRIYSLRRLRWTLALGG
jgi:hypothetical protein